MPKKKPKLEDFPAKWHVFYYNINARQIETYDIFKYTAFKTAVCKHLQDCVVKAEFAESLRRELSYYYRSRCEFEVCVAALCGDVAKKVDIYTQVYLNWDMFVDYVWSFKELYENKHKTRCQKNTPNKAYLVSPDFCPHCGAKMNLT